MITDLTTKRIEALSQRQTYLKVLPTRWRQKSTKLRHCHLTYTVLLYCGETAIDAREFTRLRTLKTLSIRHWILDQFRHFAMLNSR